MRSFAYVLILVLVEVVLGELNNWLNYYIIKGLNPCFSGSCSWRHQRKLKSRWEKGLNPCFSGSCSWSLTKKQIEKISLTVLILVLVEVVLGGSQ